MLSAIAMPLRYRGRQSPVLGHRDQPGAEVDEGEHMPLGCLATGRIAHRVGHRRLARLLSRCASRLLAAALSRGMKAQHQRAPPAARRQHQRARAEHHDQAVLRVPQPRQQGGGQRGAADHAQQLAGGPARTCQNRRAKEPRRSRRAEDAPQPLRVAAVQPGQPRPAEQARHGQRGDGHPRAPGMPGDRLGLPHIAQPQPLDLGRYAFEP
jgi:hypothetical protein